MITNQEIIDGLCYCTIMGSHAYGLSNEESDYDIYAVTIPPIKFIYPSLFGYINGFDKIPIFEQYQTKLHINNVDIDISCYSLIKYIKLLANGNPNITDSIFTEPEDVNFISPIGQFIKDHKHLFLSQEAVKKYTGYIKSELRRIQNPENKEGKRLFSIQKYGYCPKAAYHILRLLVQLRSIKNGNFRLKDPKYIPLLKKIKNGEYDKDHVFLIIENEMKAVDELPISESLPIKCHEPTIRAMLIDCLRSYYGIEIWEKYHLPKE